MSEQSVRIVVDMTRCMGSGMCLFTEPAVFDQDSVTGTVILLDDRPSTDLLDSVGRAVDACPAQAIALQVEDVGFDSPSA